MAPVRRPGARRGQDPRRAGERTRRRQRPPAQDHHLRHAEQQARQGEVVRGEADRRRRDVIFTTCDVDFAAPVVQEAINDGKLTIAPCIGTDQMGPKRFGAEGQARVLLRQRRPGRGLRDGASSRGRRAGRPPRSRRTRCSSTSRTSSRRSRRASRSSAARSSREESYQSHGQQQRQQNAVTPAERREGRRDRDASTGRSASCPRSSRASASLGNNTPILNSWAGDGTYWVTKEPAGDELLRRHLRLGLRRRPEPGRQRRSRRAASKAGTGGFVTGAAAIDGVVDRDQAGRRLARTARSSPPRWRSSRRCRRSRASSASRRSCTRSSGAQYRVIKIQNNKAQARRPGHGEGRPRRSSRVDAKRATADGRDGGPEQRSGPPRVSRSFEGVQALAATSRSSCSGTRSSA